MNKMMKLRFLTILWSFFLSLSRPSSNSFPAVISRLNLNLSLFFEIRRMRFLSFSVLTVNFCKAPVGSDSRLPLGPVEYTVILLVAR